VEAMRAAAPPHAGDSHFEDLPTKIERLLD